MDKYKIIILTLFFVIANNLNAQNSKKVKVSNSIEMHTKMDEVWTAISNLRNLDKLVPEIVKKTEMVGNGKGSVVTLTLKSNGLRVIEKITRLDNKKHIIGYKMLETLMPITNYKATIKIIPLKTNGYKINFFAVFEVLEKNRGTMETAINNFQKTLLSNIKKTYSYE